MILLKTVLQVIDKEWDNINITFAQPWEIPWVVNAGERDDYELYFLEKGNGKFVINKTEYPVSKGDVMFFNTNEENKFIADELSFRFIFVTFKIEKPGNPDLISKLNGLLMEKSLRIKPDNPQSVQEMLYQIQKLFCLKTDGYLLRNKLYLGELFYNLYEQCSEKNHERLSSCRHSHKGVNNLIIYIQNNYNRSITLDELGKMAGLHPRYLCSLFKQVTGKTVNELLREVRIEKAKRLLLYTSLSITEIAMEIGFSDSQYFSRVFCRQEKLSPSTYRNSRRKTNSNNM